MGAHQQHFIIYGLADPRSGELRYVGKSHKGVVRLSGHICPSGLKARGHRTNWLKSLLALGLKPEIFVIEELPSADGLKEAERHHIAQFRALGCNLTNLTPGGDGEGTPCSPERRAKISAAQLGVPKPRRSDASYAAQAAKARGRKRDPGAQERTAAALRGIPRPAHVIAAVRAGTARWAADPANLIEHSRKHGGRPFVDQHGRRYETIQGAARELGLSAGHICSILKGDRHMTKGFTFTYAAGS